MKLIRWLTLIVLLGIGSAAHAQHSNALSWTWTQGTGDPATGYHVWKTQTSGTYGTTPYATVSSVTTLSYTDGTVVAGQTNYYTVTAFNSGGDSPRSNEVTCVTPFQKPANAPSVSATSN